MALLLSASLLLLLFYHDYYCKTISRTKGFEISNLSRCQGDEGSVNCSCKYG